MCRLVKIYKLTVRVPKRYTEQHSIPQDTSAIDISGSSVVASAATLPWYSYTHNACSVVSLRCFTSIVIRQQKET